MKLKHPKILGSGMIIGSLPLFGFFLFMAIPVLLRPEGVDGRDLSFMAILFFFDPSLALFHIPAYILIISGILVIKFGNRINSDCRI